MSDYNKNKTDKFALGGWVAFIVCAGFFIASSVKAGDTLLLTGSIIFLAACVVFIYPLVRSGN